MNDDQSEPQGAGRALGSNYLLTSVLGTGSMGEVWRATDRSGRAFAVKLLLPGLASDPDLVRRFVTERSIALGIDSPHVVRVHDMVVEGQTLAIVMDLVDGTDLQSLLARRGTLPADEAAELGRQIATGLGAVHAHGIVHRDVKPANVLVEPGPPESARLTDFGVSFLQDASHLSHMTAVVGTPNYMAPEIIEGHRPTAASDLYSLGIMLYEMVCGVTPLATGSTMTVLRGHCQCAPGRPDGFPEPLWQIVSRLLAKSPTDRLYRAADVAAALAAAGPVLAAAPALARLRTPPPAVPLPQLDPTVIPAPDPTWVPGPASPAAPSAAPAVAPGSPYPTAAAFPPPADPRLPGGSRRRRRGLVVGALAVVVIAASTGGYLFSQRDTGTGGTAAAVVAPTNSSASAISGPVGATAPAQSIAPAQSTTPTPSSTRSPAATPSVVSAATSSYRNQRYGFGFTAPIGWSGTEDADGVTFTSPDGRATMRGLGVNTGLADCGGSLSACYQTAQDSYRNAGASITYKAHGKHWYVISGYRSNGSEYYERRHLGTASSNALVVDAPPEQQKQMEAPIGKASLSFTAGDLSTTH